MSLIKNFILILIVTGLSFEAMSFVATKLKLFLVNETPSVFFFRDYPDVVYGRTEREKWGAWHVTDLTFRHSDSCFDVTMTFNEVGARDDSFSKLPTSSIFLLGDSFAEGYGVEKEETSEHIIEEKLEVPILNFGSSGSFGPLQKLLIYKEFKHLPHQGLIVYVFPHNDFTDNDSETWRYIDQTRYRPYFSLTDDPLTPYYFPTAVTTDNFLSKSNREIKQIIKKYFWSSNAIRTVLLLIRRDAQYPNYPIKSYFFDASDRQQLHIILAYEGILEAAVNKSVLFVLIPSALDITRWKSEPDRDSYQQSYWYQSIKNFQNRTEQRVKLINLMEHLPSQTSELFFSCDGHWSPHGNEWAAKVIVEYIRNENLFEVKK
jgi:hypothetical protein